MENYLTDVSGLKVGHAAYEEAHTGVTVVIAEEGATAGVDVRGSAPGTREIALLSPYKTVDKVNAIVLSGGSAYGLDASTGVMKYLEEHDIGLETGFAKVPIVSQAVLYDLNIGDPKIRPDANLGYQACVNASSKENRCGLIGAGAGATVSKVMGFDKAMKSGLGSYSIRSGDLVVSALVVPNALGDIYADNKQLTGPYAKEKNKLYNSLELMKNFNPNFQITNTTLAIVATNASFDKAMANKIAQVSHNAYAKAIRPVHTMNDGDTIFSLCTNEIKANVDLVMLLAVEALEKAIARAIYASESVAGYIAYKDLKR